MALIKLKKNGFKKVGQWKLSDDKEKLELSLVQCEKNKKLGSVRTKGRKYYNIL